MRRALLLVAAWAAIAWLAPPTVEAQLSPGELSRAHAELEGGANCLRCHQAKRRVDPELCLACHEPLGRRIAAGEGLHSAPGYESCETCHVEHHGREFELIWWGEGGRSTFDHTLTGFVLEGAHARGECADCHRPELIGEHEELLAAGKSLERTFLGLDAACLACHRDEHRGQVAADGCLECHDSEAWRPASAFDHTRTSFPLTGRHQTAACAGCHQTRPAAAGDPSSYLLFEVPGFAQCSSCHTDPHEQRLGSDCQSCHSTSGWAQLRRGAFDHGETRFRLVGAHLRVPCEACHAPGSGFRVARFERCTDCHADEHLGQLPATGGVEGCPACHSVETFTPSTYSLTAHRASSYPLEGAHLATPCISCHELVPAAELAHSLGLSGAALEPLAPEVRRFRFSSTECQGCHGDPHRGELERWRAVDGCESCHRVEGWRDVDFDHAETGFHLSGRHADLGCGECHATPEPDHPMLLTGASAECASCHHDPHAGQFAAGNGIARCESCHSYETWRDVDFDHDRDSAFALEGAHLQLACGECHPVESRGEEIFIRYKPVGTTCEACHAGGRPAEGRRPRDAG